MVTPPNKPRRAGWKSKLALTLVVLTGSLVIAEFIARSVAGYRWTSLRLTRAEKHYEPPRTDPADVRSTLESSAPETASVLNPVASSRPDLDPEWFHQSPAFRPRGVVPEEMQRRGDDSGVAAANYLFNDDALNILLAVRERWEAMFPEGAPETMRVFTTGRTGPYPAYRYPRDVTLPSGLVLNRFGWRSQELEQIKPANTLRIACIGASTTVGDHALPFSYPELLGHWLQLWLDQRGFELTVEIINAGREAIRSTDIAAALVHEVLPFSPDVVIYYEGSNQFDPGPLVQVEPSNLSKPATGAPEATWLGSAAKYSALVQSLHGVLLRNRTLLEPTKPAQRFLMPKSAQPQPDAARADYLSLKTILGDLDTIRSSCEAQGSLFAMCSFVWMVPTGEELNAQQHHGIYGMLNDRLWPITYENVARAATLQNQVYRGYADSHGVPFFDVVARMPRDPDLFSDPLHNTSLGTRVRAWIVFEALTATIAEDLETRRLPRNSDQDVAAPPFLQPAEVRQLDAPR